MRQPRCEATKRLAGRLGFTLSRFTSETRCRRGREMTAVCDGAVVTPIGVFGVGAGGSVFRDHAVGEGISPALHGLNGWESTAIGGGPVGGRTAATRIAAEIRCATTLTSVLSWEAVFTETLVLRRMRSPVDASYSRR